MEFIDHTPQESVALVPTIEDCTTAGKCLNAYHENCPIDYDVADGPIRDEMFWSREVDLNPHLPIRLRVVQDCGTHWMMWEALQCTEGTIAQLSVFHFVDRKGRYWLLQAHYFPTRDALARHLLNDANDRWWATANVGEII